MPGGKAHAFATVAATLATPWIVRGIGVDVTTANTIAATVGCFSGLILTPDLDVNRGCRSIQTVRKEAGEIAADIWEALWKPYALLVPHRSWLSHVPVVGTAIRLGYLYGILLLIYLVAAVTGIVHLPQIPVTPDVLKNSNFVWAFFGLCLSDTLHFAMDRLFTA